MKALLVLVCICLVASLVLAEESAFMEEQGMEEMAPRHRDFNKRSLGRAPVLLIPESGDDVVGMYDPYDGTYLGDIIIDDTTGINYDLSTPLNAIQGPDDNIYLSDQVSDAIFVFDSLGNYLLTYADASDTLNNIRGIDFRNGHLFVTSGDDYVAEFDGPHSLVGYFIQDGSDPFDILFLDDGSSLLCDIQGSTDNVRLYDSTGTLRYQVFSVAFPEQVQEDAILPGAFLNASFSDDIITDFDLDSTITDQLPFNSGRGIYRLGNGNLLATSGSGVFELDSATGVVVEQENTGSARFIELYSVAASIEEGERDKPGFFRLTASPNPFTAGTSIELLGANLEQPLELKVYDVSGKLVLSRSLESRISYLGTALSPGIYFISVNGSAKQKIIKVR